MFRVGDMRKSHIICATVRAQLIRTRTTKEGEVLHQHQAELMIGTDGGDNNLFFIWPMTVVHRINSESPLYNISASDIIDRESRFEIIVILEGKCIVATHMLKHARTNKSNDNFSLFTLTWDMGSGCLSPFIPKLVSRWR
jgi:potassium inwardly-rectifying channel subfamily J